MSACASRATSARVLGLLACLGCSAAAREPAQANALRGTRSPERAHAADGAPGSDKPRNASLATSTRAEPTHEAAPTPLSEPLSETPAPEPAASIATGPASAKTPSTSTSVGAPGAGELRGAIALPDEGVGFLHNPKRPHAARFATFELISAIERAAATVEAEHPGIKLVVNDLSLEHGGPIAQHGSHQNGRDADILFYSLDQRGEPIQSVGVPLDPSGRGFDFKDLSTAADDQPVRLDAKRTLRFIAALIEHAGDDLQRIFIAEHVRALLLAEAVRARIPTAVRERFELVTCQPGTPHDDHMHVRFHCTPEDMAEGCLDSAPAYPFRKQALAALGLTPRLETAVHRKARRKAVAARTTSPAEARRKAGPMHARVREFLARREAWLPQPHPGRPFCR